MQEDFINRKYIRLAILQVEKDKKQEKMKGIDDDIRCTEKRIRKALEKGETTGDRIRDMVLRTHGFNHELEKKCSAFEEQLKGKKGEFVLVAFSAPTINVKNISVTRGIYEPNRMQPCLRLGVLEEEALTLASDTLLGGMAYISLPASKYVELWQHAWLPNQKGKVEVKEKNILSPTFGEEKNLRPLTELLSEYDQDTFDRMVVVGDEKVQEWAKNHSMEGMLKPAADALGKPPLA